MTTSSAPSFEIQHDHGSVCLPNESLTLDGLAFDPQNDHWHLWLLGVSAHFKFAHLRTSLPDVIIDAFKALVMVRLRSHSLASTQAFYYIINKFLKHFAKMNGLSTHISSQDLMEYRSSLSEEKKYQSSVLHGYLLYWNDLDLPCLSEGAVAYCEDIRDAFPVSGAAVRTQCPINGPLSSLEFSALTNGLHANFGEDKITLYNYSVSLLTLCLGVRPGQIALLKMRDLQRTDDAEGAKYHLHVPRLKQRGASLRTLHRTRELISEVGEVLQKQIDDTLARHGKQAETGDFPMFPVAYRRTAGPYSDQHTSSVNIGRRIAYTLESLGVISERTGEPINATATRLRRTVATRMAQEGYPTAVISDTLDHEDEQSTKIYAAIRAEMIERVDKKMALHMAPLAQRFAGTFVEPGTTEVAELHPIFGTTTEGGCPTNIGGCGKFAFCFLAKPLACYTCVNFRPWIDAPHEELLDQLVEQRERQRKLSSRVAEALDDTILAVASVVHVCREAKSLAREDRADG